MFALRERSDRAAVDVLSGATDQRAARATENVNESWAVTTVFPPCASGDLNVVGEDFELILSPRANLFREEPVVAYYVPFRVERHRCCSKSSCAQSITPASGSLRRPPRCLGGEPNRERVPRLIFYPCDIRSQHDDLRARLVQILPGREGRRKNY